MSGISLRLLLIVELNLLHCDKVCACILQGNILELLSTTYKRLAFFSFPLPIIPIDTFSTWACLLCCAAPIECRARQGRARSCAPHPVVGLNVARETFAAQSLLHPGGFLVFCRLSFPKVFCSCRWKPMPDSVGAGKRIVARSGMAGPARQRRFGSLKQLKR